MTRHLARCSLWGAVELPYSRSFLFEAILRTAHGTIVAIVASDPAAGTIRGRLPTTLFFWGPLLELRLERVAVGMTRVRFEAHVEERSPGQLQRFREYTDARLSRLLQDACALLETPVAVPS